MSSDKKEQYNTKLCLPLFSWSEHQSSKIQDSDCVAEADPQPAMHAPVTTQWNS